MNKMICNLCIRITVNKKKTLCVAFAPFNFNYMSFCILMQAFLFWPKHSTCGVDVINMGFEGLNKYVVIWWCLNSWASKKYSYTSPAPDVTQQDVSDRQQWCWRLLVSCFQLWQRNCVLCIAKDKSLFQSYNLSGMCDANSSISCITWCWWWWWWWRQWWRCQQVVQFCWQYNVILCYNVLLYNSARLYVRALKTTQNSNSLHSWSSVRSI